MDDESQLRNITLVYVTPAPIAQHDWTFQPALFAAGAPWPESLLQSMYSTFTEWFPLLILWRFSWSLPLMAPVQGIQPSLSIVPGQTLVWQAISGYASVIVNAGRRAPCHAKLTAEAWDLECWRSRTASVYVAMATGIEVKPIVLGFIFIS
jgi:hypothetical protein